MCSGCAAPEHGGDGGQPFRSLARGKVCHRDRQEQERGGEDWRNHARAVDLKRQVRRVALEHAVADLALGILHEQPPLRPLHEHDDADHDDSHDEQQDDQRRRQRALPAELERSGHGMRQLRHDTGEDDQRNAVSDAPRRDLLAEPHQEHGAADEREHGGDAEEEAGVEHHMARAFEAHGDAVALQRREEHRPVAGILIDLAASGLAFLFQRLQMRRDRGQQLDDDRGRDIRHDVERKDRHAPNRTTREHVEHAEDAGLVLPEHVGKRLGIDAWNRDIGAEPVNEQRAKREPDALLELVGLGEGREIEIGDQLFGGGNHRAFPSLAEGKRGGRRPPSHQLKPCLSWPASASPVSSRPRRPLPSWRA